MGGRGFDEPMIRFDEVTYTYAGAPRPAVRELTLQLNPGEILAVLGANGSGKSTLACLVNGLLLPASGRVSVADMDTADESTMWDVRSQVGLVLQDPDDQIVGTVVEEDVAFGPENLGVESAEIRVRVDEVLAIVGLTGFERREPHLLSGGQKQRLAIAGALAMHPDYLVLDEPTAMLDSAGRESVLALIERLRAQGVGILFVTHHLADVIHADRAIVLDEGRVAFTGTPIELLGQEEVLASCGLEVPPLQRVESTLRAAGLPLPTGPLAVESIVEALCN